MNLRISLLLVVLFTFIFSSTSQAEVGYINILNGVDPPKAFTVERQGKLILPDNMYTDLEDGDIVKPSADAFLLFSPLDIACESVEINGEFIASPCPQQTSDIKDIAYDFVSDKFLATPPNEVGTFTTRGAKDPRIYSLPPQALKVYSDSEIITASLKKTPFISLIPDEATADVKLKNNGKNSIELVPAGQSQGKAYKIPEEQNAMRQALFNYINFNSIARLNNPDAWPDVTWKININTPSDSGSINFDGKKWGIDRTVEIKEDKLKTSVPKVSLLDFEINNQSSHDYYAYFINYTDDGQLLLILPPESHSNISNFIPAGKNMAFPQLQLEVVAPVEYVRLIISEKILDLSEISQDNFDSKTENTVQATRLRPAPQNSLKSITAELVLN
jgi:hypothetical protein